MARVNAPIFGPVAGTFRVSLATYATTLGYDEAGLRSSSSSKSSQMKPGTRSCQTNSNPSPLGQGRCPLSRAETTPLGESSGAFGLEMRSAGEASLVVEMVGDGGVDGGEHLQTSHAPEAEHRPLSSSERQVCILRTVVQPAAGFLPVGDAQVFHGRSVGPQLVGHVAIARTMFLHSFPKKLQSCLLVPGLCYKALKHLTLVIDRAPEIMPLAVDLHEHLVEVPSPVAGFHALDPAFPDLSGEQRAEPMPPEPDGFMADLDTALMQQILDVPKREREPDVHHHRQADDLAARLEVLEWVRLGHAETLASALPRLKLSLSDKTARLHALDAALPDLGGKHRTEPMPPKSDRLVADVDATLVQQILDIAERERKANVQHHRQADDLLARLEVFEGAALAHGRKLLSALPRRKPSCSDTARS